MSAKDATGVESGDTLFESPNIASSADDIPEELLEDKKAEEQKKREAVDIDDTPLDEKDIKYHAADIRKKKKMEYFVNVEGAEARARAEEKKKAEEKKAIARVAKDFEKQAIESQANAEKEAVEENKKYAEVTKYIKKQKAKNAKKAKAEARKAKSKKRNIIILCIVLVLIIAGAVTAIIISKVNADREAEIAAKQKEEEDAAFLEEYLTDPFNAAKYRLDKSEKLDNELLNYAYDEVDLVYDEELEKLENDYDKARLYMDKAKRHAKYHPDDYEHIVEAAETAYAYAPDDLMIMNDLIEIYKEAGMDDKIEPVEKHREEVMELQSEIHSQEDDDDDDGSQREG